MSTGKSRLDTGLIRELAAILREADLGELEVEFEGLRVKVVKPVPAALQAYAAAPMAMAAPAAPAPAAATAEASAVAAASKANTVNSPMVGTVYLSPEPGSKAFVNVGDRVKKGDTLMLVEAMKTFNPVESPRDGIVQQIIVEDAQPVEYGEPLITIA